MRQALVNVTTVLAEAGGKPEHLTQLTCFITDKRRFFAEGKACGEAQRVVLGGHYPATTMVEVRALLEDRALIEIAAIAVSPDRPEPGAGGPSTWRRSTRSSGAAGSAA